MTKLFERDHTCKFCEGTHIKSWMLASTGYYQGRVTKQEAETMREYLKGWRLPWLLKRSISAWCVEGLLRLDLARILLQTHEDTNKLSFDQWAHLASVIKDGDK